ncbi:MAG: LysR family transcriptional regulator [Clostridiales bacterium]|nr:LysR family transcriptional regulator [Clostridiales bacterium]
MTLNQIIYFEKTAERMHMASAAKELMIAQPSLSMSLSKLEDELGVPLFEKRGRGIALTAEGEVFLYHARQIIRDVDAATREMKRLKDQAEDTLTIAYINPLSEHFLPQLFRAFQSSVQAASAHLKSVEMDTGEIIQALQNNTVDLAFSSAINGHTELTQIPILRQPLVLIVPKGHWMEQKYQQEGVSLAGAELNGAPMVTYFERSPMHKPIMDYLQQQNVQPDLCHCAYNESAIANLVAEGMGVAILAKVDHLPWDRIVQVPLEGLTSSRDIFLTYRTNRKLFRTARQMVQFVQQEYRLANGQ